MASTKVKLLDSSVAIPTGAVAVTQSASDNTTKIATTAYVTTALANLSDSAPSTLNTLNELAAALGDDANYATTTTNAIAAKLPLAGGTMTGNIAHASDFTIDAGGDITLDADGGDIILKDGGTHWASLYTNGTHTYIQNMVSDGDVYLSGKDGSSFINALVLDMSQAGYATFNSGVSLGGETKLGDNSKLILGAGDDLQLYHDSSNSYIKSETGWLNLPMGGNGLSIANGDFSEMLAKFVVNGAVELYHNGSKKLETNSGGATITGITSSSHLALGGATVANSYLIEATAAGGNIIRSTRGSSVFASYQSNNSHVYLGTTSNNEFRIIQNDGAAITIDTNKYVGIGTTAPGDYNSAGRNLVVASSGQSGISIVAGTSNDSSIMFADGTGGTAGYRGRIGYDHATDDMVFHTAGAERVRILDTGEVGIGGVPSVAPLDIKSSNSGKYLYMDDGTNVLFSLSADGTSAGIIQTQGTGWSSWKPMDLRANYFMFKPNNTEIMRILSDAVGIGISSPSTPLHIQSNDGTTNSVKNLLTLTTLSTGTTTTGFGPGINFQAERNNGVNQNVGAIQSIAETNSGTNISSGMGFFTSLAGVSTETLRLTKDGNALLRGGKTSDEVYMDIFSDSGSNRGAGYFRFITDGASAEQSVAQIYMEQGSGDGGSRKCNMYFQVSDNGSPTTALTIANNKQVTTAGDLIVGADVQMANGRGIQFNSTTPDGTSVGSETFDDYEEGTWTPAFYTYSGVTTSSISSYAIYTKIGRVCHIHAKITCTLSSLPGQTVIITGLPFAAVSSGDGGQRAIISIGGDTMNTGGNTPKAHFRTDGSQLQGIYWNASNNTAYWAYNGFDSSTFEMHISGSYTT